VQADQPSKLERPPRALERTSELAKDNAPEAPAARQRRALIASFDADDHAAHITKSYLGVEAGRGVASAPHHSLTFTVHSQACDSVHDGTVVVKADEHVAEGDLTELETAHANLVSRPERGPHAIANDRQSQRLAGA
jgi:hypothetical protein